jgi:hypothetical protein
MLRTMASFELGRDAALLVLTDTDRECHSGDTSDEPGALKLEASQMAVLAAWRATGRRVFFGSIHDGACADELAAAGIGTLVLLGGRAASESTASAVARATALGHRTFVVSDGSGARHRHAFIVDAATVVVALARATAGPALGWPFSLEPV